MRKLVTMSLIAGIASIAVPVQSAPISQDEMQPIVIARNGADNPPGDVRHTRGADNLPGDVRRGRGADNPPGDVRRGRGADGRVKPQGGGTDNPPGDDRGRGHGRDDGVGHA